MTIRQSLLLLAGAALAAPVPALAADPPVRTITAIAAARVTLNRALPKNDAAIRAAVERARQRAVPMALANARTQADRLAKGAGLTLGEVWNIEEMVPPHFGHWAFGTDGTFGPGKFCGTVRQRSFRRLPNGRRVPTGKARSRFTCRIPFEVQHTVKVTFAVA
jgi:uncharacterized protein DUF541